MDMKILLGFFTCRIDNSDLELLSAVSLNFVVHSTVLYTRHHMYTLCLIYSEGSKKGNKLERTQTCSSSPYSLSSLQCSMKFVPYIFHWSILSFLATLCSSLADRYIEQYCSVYLYNVQFHTTELNALMLSHPSIDLFVALTCSHIFSPLCSSPLTLLCIRPPTPISSSLFFSTLSHLSPFSFLSLSVYTFCHFTCRQFCQIKI